MLAPSRPARSPSLGCCPNEVTIVSSVSGGETEAQSNACSTWLPCWCDSCWWSESENLPQCLAQPKTTGLQTTPAVSNAAATQHLQPWDPSWSGHCWGQRLCCAPPGCAMTHLMCRVPPGCAVSIPARLRDAAPLVQGGTHVTHFTPGPRRCPLDLADFKQPDDQLLALAKPHLGSQLALFPMGAAVPSLCPSTAVLKGTKAPQHLFPPFPMPWGGQCWTPPWSSRRIHV